MTFYLRFRLNTAIPFEILKALLNRTKFQDIYVIETKI